MPALGNTNATITFNLKHQADVNTEANSMLVEEEQKHFIGELPIGHAIVKLQSRYPKPFLVKVPQAKLVKGAIQNQDIATYMQAYSASSGGNKPCLGEKHKNLQIPQADKVTEEAEEITLFRDIHQKPFSSIVKRYQRLNISGRQGNKFQLLLIKQGLIEPVNISIKRGRLKLFKITERGYSVLAERGITCKQFMPSVEHEFWKWIVASWHRKQGYQVETEKKIINGFAVDLLASKGKEKIAIEIETGKSDIALNLRNALKKKFTKIISIATNPEALAKIKETLGKCNIVDARLEVNLAKEYS